MQQSLVKTNKDLPQELQMRLEALLHKHRVVFRDDWPDGLPPKRTMDHNIELLEDTKTPHRPLLQLSPAELLAALEYVTELKIKK